MNTKFSWFVTWVLVTHVTCLCGAQVSDTKRDSLAQLFKQVIRPIDVPLLKVKSRSETKKDSIVVRPKRHFGIFTQGSDLKKIQLYIGQSSGGTNIQSIYFNDFFSAVNLSGQERSIYAKYFQNGTLPTNALPANTPAHVPGLYRPYAGANASRYFGNELILRLDRVEYSSLYGGSMKAVFSQDDMISEGIELRGDDFEYEFMWGNRIFDVKGLEVAFFVNPRPGNLNPMSNVAFTFSGGAELSAQQVSMYEGGRRVKAEAVVAEKWDSLTALVAKSLIPNLTDITSLVRFLHGFLHVQFESLIASDDKVVKLMISDNFCDLVTEKYEEVRYLYFKISAIVLPMGFNPELDEECKIRIDIYHSYVNGQVQMAPIKYELGTDDDDYWHFLGGWTLDEYSALTAADLMVKIREIDPISDDKYLPVYIHLAPPLNPSVESHLSAVDIHEEGNSDVGGLYYYFWWKKGYR